VEGLQEGFSAFIMGFFRIFVVSVIIWMIGLIVLLFREMFSAHDFNIREYLYKVWKMLLASFEWTAYVAVVVAPIIMIVSKNYLTYGMVTLAAIILSVIYLYIRKQTGGFSKEKLRMRKER
jgi:hypothetical protein